MLRIMISILHRFANFEAAKRAIQELNCIKPCGFRKQIDIKSAHFDIGDKCNGWTGSRTRSSRWSRTGSIPTSNVIHFNQNMFENFLIPDSF